MSELHCRFSGQVLRSSAFPSLITRCEAGGDKAVDSRGSLISFFVALWLCGIFSFFTASDRGGLMEERR